MALSYALTTLQRQKDFMAISAADWDTILDRLIDSATDFIEEYCDRRFQETTHTNEVYDGTGNHRLLLSNYPVDSGESFTLQQRNSRNNENSWSTQSSEDFFVKYQQGIVEFAGRSFTDAPQHYRFTYTAGYEYDLVATFLSDVGAADLEYACWKLVSNTFNRRKSSGDIKAESIGDYSVTFSDEFRRDPEIIDILNRYMRPNPM